MAFGDMNRTIRPSDEARPAALLASIPGLESFTRYNLTRALVVGSSFAALSAIIALVVPSRYRASSAFTNSTNRDVQLGGLSAARSLAEAFGVAGGSGATAPEFFQAVAELRSVRERMLQARYPYVDGDSTVQLSLLDIYDVGSSNPRRRIEKSVDKLGKHLRVSFDRVTGIVTVQATASQPLLAAAMVDTAIALLNAANIATRQAQAREERIFLEARLSATWDSLAAVEQALVNFHTNNRTYTTSPQLVLEEARLRRHLDLATQVYNGLASEVERARMQEVRSTPVLTVLDPAVPPAQRYWPKRKLIVAVGGLLGLAIGLFAQGRAVPST